MKTIFTIIITFILIVQVIAQNDKNIVTSTMDPSNYVNVKPVKIILSDIKIGGCKSGAINNPIFLVDGLSIIDSTCNGIIKSLNYNLISKIEIINNDTIFDSHGLLCARGLLKIVMNDTVYKSIKLLNKLSKEWTLTHPLTKYKINQRLISDSEKINKFDSLDINSIIKLDTIMNIDFPEGLIKISLK